jgi:hypothetical protein
VFLPFAIILRADLVLTVIVALTVLAEAAVLAFHVIGASSAVGTNMLVIFLGQDAVTVRASFVLAVFIAAILAQSAVGTGLPARRFHALAALFADPVVVKVAFHAVNAVGRTPLDSLFPETVVALGTMGF